MYEQFNPYSTNTTPSYVRTGLSQDPYILLLDISDPISSPDNQT